MWNVSDTGFQSIRSEACVFRLKTCISTPTNYLSNSWNQATMLNFGCQMKAILGANDNPILLMCKKVHFYLNGMVNQQNCRYWTLENPRELHAKPLHNPKMTVWCAVGKATFLKTIMEMLWLNSDRYIEMINFFVPELRRKQVPILRVWFQQVGVTAHTARWFGLVSLFNDISTFVGYLMPKLFS